MSTDPLVSVDPSSARDPLIFTLDVGTSSVRALVYDAEARAVTGWEVHRPFSPTTTPDGGVVIEADDLAGLAFACIDELAASVHIASRRAAAVACGVFWHSLLALGPDGVPLTPVLTWADTRSAADATALRHRLDAAVMHQRTGAYLHPSYPTVKLAWIARTNPDLFARATHWVSFAEYLWWRLFGELRVSISMASGSGLFDQHHCRWDQEMLDALSVREDQLSPIADYSDDAPALSAELAGRWPALSGARWYLPVGDGAASNIGAGGCGDGVAVLMVGTSGAMRVVRAADAVNIPDELWTYRVDRRRFVQGGALSAGGNIFAWATKTLQVGDPAAAEARTLAMPPDNHGLTVLPFLAGERSPDWNPDARSVIVGITLHTGPDDMLRALLEAVAYRFGLLSHILRREIPTVRAIIGSGAGLIHSPAWIQLMTDVLGHRLAISAVPEASSRGAAILALEALKIIPEAGVLAAPLAATYAPRPDHTAVYRQAQQRQEALYRRMMLGSSSADYGREA